MRWLALVATFAACKKHDPPVTGPLPFDEQVVALPPGTSDLSLDETGTLWAIAEREHVIAEIHVLAAGSGAPTLVMHALDGVPDGLDTEALAWLGAGTIAIGTEGQTDPTASVLYAKLRADGHFVVERERPLAPAELGVALTNNHGVEGMCGRGDELLLSIESVGKRADGARWTPLVHLRGTEAAHTTKLWMTTSEGKISALSCVFNADGSIALLAIERHYGVSRILRAKLPPDASEITPEVAVDLFPYNHDRLNLEGIVVLADGRWMLVNDNQGTRVDGPTELLTMHPR